MPTAAENNKRIAKNTLILYGRMLIMALIGLYTSRVVLNALGVVNYGIYNAVGGFVAMFSLLSGVLTNSINRFLTFELGRGDMDKLKRVFCTALNVMALLSSVILLLGATVGVWFLNTQMNIPEDRIGAANIVLACSVFTFILTLICMPYNAAIIAHERMSVFARLTILDVLLKLLVAYLLTVSPIDVLILYALLLLCISILMRFIYAIYSKRHFEECTYHFIVDKPLLKEMTSFAGWNFLAAGAALINVHGINVMMNLFFGVVVNAARGVANQVNAHVVLFVTNFMTAMNPQITKSYAQGDYTYMHSLICRGAKFSFFLVYFFMLPLCLETHQVLHLWLGIIPEYAVPFVQLTLATSALNVLSSPLITGLHATGNIKRYMIIVGVVEIMNFPITYIVFKLGGTPQSAYYVYLVIYFILMLLRLFLIKDLIHMKASMFVRKVYVPVLVVSVLSCIVPILVFLPQEENLVRFISVFLVSFASTAACAYYAGLEGNERVMIVNLIKKKLHHN